MIALCIHKNVHNEVVSVSDSRVIVLHAGNATNLPMMVIATLCDDPSSMAARNLGGVCQQTGLAYVAFGSYVSSPSPAGLLNLQVAIG